MSAGYRAEVTAIGGRRGRVLSADGALRLALALPGGDRAAGPATNPEQLLAAGLAASFLDAIGEAAQGRGLVLASDSNVTAAVERAGGDVALVVRLTIDLPSIDSALARELVAEAGRSCPLSAALRNRVEVALSIA